MKTGDLLMAALVLGGLYFIATRDDGSGAKQPGVRWSDTREPPQTQTQTQRNAVDSFTDATNAVSGFVDSLSRLFG